MLIILHHNANCLFNLICHLHVRQISEQPLFVPGVWGPCLSAMVPGMWLNEGGQSATGRLVSPLASYTYDLTDLLYAA